MKEKEEIKLLRCPSCGDMVYTDLLEEEHADSSISEYHAVICQNCGAMVIGAYDNRYKYCHHNDTDEHRDCLGYLQREDLECEECPYYYEDLDKGSGVMDEDEFRYCHIDDTDEYHDCLDYMECEECPYYFADLD